MKKEEFDLHVKMDIYQEKDALSIIQSLINWLIDILYVPDPGLVRVVDRKRIKELSFDDEAINWGDLKCYAVESYNGKYIAYVDEVDPTAYRF